MRAGYHPPLTRSRSSRNSFAPRPVLSQRASAQCRPRAPTSRNAGTEVVVRAPPDGYTLLMVVATNAIKRETLREPQLQFDPRHRAGCEHCRDVLRHVGQSIIPGQSRIRLDQIGLSKTTRELPAPRDWQYESAHLPCCQRLQSSFRDDACRLRGGQETK